MKKLLDEDFRTKELDFYKELAQAKVGKATINTMLAQYKSNLMNQDRGPKWSFYEDPPKESPQEKRSLLPTFRPDLPPSRVLAQNPNLENAGPPPARSQS